MSVEIYSELKLGRPLQTVSDTEEDTYSFLEACGVDFECITHSPADTIEACHTIEKQINSSICKNLFLKNSAQTQYYLLLLDGNTKFDSKIVSHQIGSTRLSFGPEEKLCEYLKLKPGSVSIMGLIHDKNKNVNLLIQDKLLEKEFFCCHPCVNTATIRIQTNVIINKFIPALGRNFTTVHL